MKQNKKEDKGNNISEEGWKIVEARLKTMPNKMRSGLLSNSYTQEDLLIEVQERTEVGIVYAEMQIEFIKWLMKQSNVIQLS